MADIFVSYARGTVDVARTITESLRALGYEVWIDDALPVHRDYSTVLDEQLDTATAVLVLWSGEGVRSQWVRAEANRAREAGKLIQVTVEPTRLPLPFEQIQCADLAGWGGDPQHPGWRKVIYSLSELVGAPGHKRNHPETRAPARAVPVLAVLAFDSLSTDADLALFADGLSEEILQDLARSSDLKVLGRSSSFQLRGADKAAARVASVLGATHVLDGSVRRSTDRLRVTTQLVDCATGTVLWSDRYDEPIGDVFAVQDRIASAVAGTLAIALAPHTHRPPRMDPTVHDMYLRARALSVGDAEPVIRLLERVTALEPAFAPAWATLAEARAWRGRFASPKGFNATERTRAAKEADTALRLDPHAGMALLALSFVAPYRHYAERERLTLQAMAAAPSDASIRTFASSFYSSVGRHQHALVLVQEARRLDPWLHHAVHRHASCLTETGDWPAALELFEAARDRWPANDRFTGNPLLFCALRGQWAKFDDLCRQTGAEASRAPEIRRALFVARALRQPTTDVKERVLNELRRSRDHEHGPDLSRVVLAAHMGLVEEVFEVLHGVSFASLFDARTPSPGGGFNVSQIFSTDVLWRDERFLDLCGAMGLCDFWSDSDTWPDCAERTEYDFKAGAHRRRTQPE